MYNASCLRKRLVLVTFIVYPLVAARLRMAQRDIAEPPIQASNTGHELLSPKPKNVAFIPNNAQEQMFRRDHDTSWQSDRPMSVGDGIRAGSA
jgi:hypothetical protein